MTKEERFLIRFHRDHPGSTPSIFDLCRTANGETSYQILAKPVPRATRVLDLGCGNGHLLDHCRQAGHSASDLFGVDLSTFSLGNAAARPTLANVGLAQARAQDLPLRTGVIDHVLCHLVLMLINPLTPALSEVARVLKPGGMLHAMMGGGPAVTDAPHAVDIFLEALAAVMPSPTRASPVMVDQRLRRASGLAGYLEETQLFAEVHTHDVYVTHDGTANEIWPLLRNQYECAEVSGEALTALKAEFIRRCERRYGSTAGIQAVWALRCVRARRVNPGG
ncbi:MAG: class I SAM-dependent methyltransferase [Myxococcota bacterium]|nr:class I SAM-dependent methyltransferase [Myxococcota bacterium]